MVKPSFSVVIPTFNRAEKLLRGLKSLNNQTFRNFEVLVCDDGSTDRTRSVVEEFRKEITFLGLRYFYGSNWGGPARPRNIGVQAAFADWICFLDSDDIWYPEKLECILPHLKEYDIIYHAFDVIGPSGKAMLQTGRQPKHPVFRDLMLNGHNGCIINSGVSIRKELIEKVGGVAEDPMLIGVEDADLWLRVSRITSRFKYVQRRLGMYFLDGGNITTYNQRMIDKLVYLFDLHIPFLENEHYRNLAKCTNDYHLGRISRLMGENAKALKSHLSALGSPNYQLVLRSIFWIPVLYWKSKIIPRIKKRYYFLKKNES